MTAIAPPKLDWMDVLNEQFEWNTTADLKKWFSKLVGRQPDFSKTAINEFQKCLHFIREQVSALHFNEPVDIKALDKKLSSIKLSMAKADALPTLHAKAQGTSDADLLKAMEETILVQFASFVSEFLAREDATLNRCEGLFKEHKSFDDESLAPPMETEKRWRKEIPILIECKLLSSPDIHRCGDFFIGKAKARFCSEACRFRTFQLNKQLTDPDYLKDKQRRYRQNQQ